MGGSSEKDCKRERDDEAGHKPYAKEGLEESSEESHFGTAFKNAVFLSAPSSATQMVPIFLSKSSGSTGTEISIELS